MIHLAYLASAVAFIVGLKRLGGPRTARSGNVIAAFGMLIAVVATLVNSGILNWAVVLGGLAVGTVLGAWAALRVHMTAMPQMVAILNGLGGAASALVAADVVIGSGMANQALDTTITIVVSTITGTITFTGSLVAFAKLQGLVSGNPLLFRGQRALNIVATLVMVGLAGGALVDGSTTGYWALAGIAALIGVLAVVAIGGADMPVVIALLNSLSGLSAAAAGFVITNNALIIGGALVGAAGLILTFQMTEAMNRSIANVLFSGFGAVTAGAGDIGTRPVNRADADDVAVALGYSSRVMIVPGYGLAVAQAQHATRDLARALEERGVTVNYAIHPVAGRMPGHMNVLLAEADVPYHQLLDLEQADPQMATTDAVLVLGANDVVNPSARDDPGSPIYGMPIFNVDRAGRVVVVKRSLSPGFAGIDNPLFYEEKTMMFFADAKVALEQVLEALEGI